MPRPPTAPRPTGRKSSRLYDVLLAANPSAVVELNRAVAVAMRDGPAAGLSLIEAILARGDLEDYYLAYSALADLNRRLGRTAEARAGYEQSLRLARQEPARRFLERRLEELKCEAGRTGGMKVTVSDLRRHAIASSLFPETTLRRAIGRIGFIQADPIRSPRARRI